MSLLLALGGPVFGHTACLGHLHLEVNEGAKRGRERGSVRVRKSVIEVSA